MSRVVLITNYEDPGIRIIKYIDTGLKILGLNMIKREIKQSPNLTLLGYYLVSSNFLRESLRVIQ